ELIKAIDWFSNARNVDLLIVGRGGGSLEDLWPFNEEAVARALFNCQVPTISAVGHEVDFSITDFVADARAATPTQAAILAAPDINEVRLFTDDLSTRLHTATEERLSSQKERIQQLVKSHAMQAIQQKVAGMADHIRGLDERLHHRQEVFFIKKHNKLSGLQHRLKAQNPNAPLEQGYTRIWQNDHWIRYLDTIDAEKASTIEWKEEDI